MTEHDDEDTRATSAVAWVAVDEDAGERADVVLGRRIEGLSRRVARRLALGGALRIDGARARPSDRVSAGQQLILALPATDAGTRPLDVLACTEHFVYVAKPAGVHTIALTPSQADCLSVWVARQYPECASASEDPREAGAVHRLDRDTSGVVAFARTARAWQRARAAFEAGEVAKRYLAVCVPMGEPGWPPTAPDDALPGWLDPAQPLDDPVPMDGEPSARPEAWRIRAPIGRGDQRGTMSVRLDGQRATTVVQVRGRAPGGLVCELELVTGRRHQARVHLAWAGLPIRGDARYGAPPGGDDDTTGAAGPHRLRLHAARLDLSGSFPDEAPVTCPPDASLFAP